MNDTFWNHVDASGDCWEWTGCTDRDGYGQFSTAWRTGRTRMAHRFAWEELVGSIPDGLVTDHLCRNTTCVNPDHLEMVTQGENVRRGIGLSVRTTTHCQRGHSMADAYIHPATGKRKCRTCLNMRGRVGWIGGDDES